MFSLIFKQLEKILIAILSICLLYLYLYLAFDPIKSELNDVSVVRKGDKEMVAISAAGESTETTRAGISQKNCRRVKMRKFKRIDREK